MWKTTWGCAHRGTWFTEWNQNSFNYTVFNNLEATAIRLTFSNWYGQEDVRVKSVKITYDHNEYSVTYAENTDFLVKAGEFNNIVSDAVIMPIHPGPISVDVEFNDYRRPQSGQTFLKPAGIVMILQTIEVLCDDGVSVAVFGDSISHWGMWTEPYKRYLQENRRGKVALYEMAVNGSRLLNDSPKQWLNCWGYAAKKRVQHDILQACDGLDICIIDLGINDMGISVDLDEIEFSFDEYVKEVNALCNMIHERNIKVIGLTLCARDFDDIFSEKENELRKKINTWIMTEAPFDEAYDIASAVKNDEDSSMKKEYICEDGFHLNELGGSKVAQYLVENMVI